MAACCLALLTASRSAAAPPARTPPQAALSAELSCAEEPATGRLTCTVELAAPGAYKLSWSDAVVVSAPESARPLRSRVRSAQDPARIVLGFVLGPGQGGRIELVVRAVMCPLREGAACRTGTERLASEVAAR